MSEGLIAPPPTEHLLNLLRDHFKEDWGNSCVDPLERFELGIELTNNFNQGIDIDLRLRQEGNGQYPSCSLILAVRDFKEAKKLADPWEYLLWLTEQEGISIDLKLDRLQTIFYNLHGPKEQSSLAVAILRRANGHKIPSKVVIYSAGWLVQVSGIKVLLELQDTIGQDGQHISMPYLVATAKDPSFLDIFRRFFLEATPEDRILLCKARCEALNDEDVILIHRNYIAAAMLEQLHQFDDDFLFYWEQYSDALILFYQVHPDPARKTLVVDVVTYVTQKASQLLSCF